MATVYGAPYDHLRKILAENGFLHEVDWLDASDRIVARAVFDGAGGYDLTLQGSLFVQKRTYVFSNQYFLKVFTPGTAFGNHFDYYMKYFSSDSASLPFLLEWRDATDKVVASESLDASGGIAAIYAAASGSAWGLAYTACKTFYDPSGLGPGVVTRKIWYDADFLVAQETFSAAVHDLYLVKSGYAFGQAYSAIDEAFDTPSGRLSRVTYYTDKGTMTQTIAADRSYDVSIPTGSGAGDFSSYDVFVDSSGFNTRTDYYDDNGLRSRVETFHRDGGHDSMVYIGGTAWGLHYASVDYFYPASDGLARKETYFTESGAVLIVKSAPSGLLNGYDVEIFQPGVSSATFLAYASRDYSLDAGGKLLGLTLYDSNHNVVERRSF